MMKSQFNRFYDSTLINDYKKILDGNCIYLPNHFCKTDDLTIFNQLQKEIEENKDYDFVDWSKHKKHENPEFSPTFNDVIEKLKTHFNVEVFATRLNYYRDGNDSKPFHRDRHNYNSAGQKEDFTMGVSFGASRTLEFLHEQSDNKFSFPQNNGDIFAFNSSINEKFLHGVPKVHKPTGPRFSIIAWGKRNN